MNHSFNLYHSFNQYHGLVKEEGGFTLIEVLLTMVILSILIIPVFSYLGSSNQLIRETEKRSLAVEIARTAMGKLQAAAHHEFVKLPEIAAGLSPDDPLFSGFQLQGWTYSLKTSLYPYDFNQNGLIDEKDKEGWLVSIRVIWPGNEQGYNLKGLAVAR